MKNKYCLPSLEEMDGSLPLPVLSRDSFLHPFQILILFFIIASTPFLPYSEEALIAFSSLQKGKVHGVDFWNEQALKPFFRHTSKLCHRSECIICNTSFIFDSRRHTEGPGFCWEDAIPTSQCSLIQRYFRWHHLDVILSAESARPI